MKKTVALLALALAASTLGTAQTSNKQKPSASVTRDSATRQTPAVTPSYPATQQTQATAQCAKLTDDNADLPTGTAVKMKLETALSSKESKEGDGFSGRVTEDVVVNGKTIIPVGASVSGRLLRVSDPRRIGGVGSIQMLPEAVMLPNGKSFAINAALVDTSLPSYLKVDEEGRVKGEGISKGDKVEMAGGTGAGMIVGAIAGGGKGMLVGGMVGGGATVVHWLTKRHSVDIPAGTELIMEISRPMNVSNTPMSAGE
jgi:hypothetical protein